MSQPAPFTKQIFICGSALQGQPDHQNLQFVQCLGAAKTRPIYRMHVAGNAWHPAIYEVREGGISIPGELYEQTQAQFDALCASEPPHMYPAEIVLENGKVVIGFLYPKAKIEEYNLLDISAFGGWVAYKASLQQEEDA